MDEHTAAQQPDYRVICDLVNHISQVPVRYFDRDKHFLFSCPRLKREEDFVQTDAALLDEIYARCAVSRYPTFFATDLNECLSAIPVDYGAGLSGVFIAGPVLTSEATYDGILQYSRARDLPLQYTHKLLRKYQQMTVMRLDRFGALPKVIYFQLYQKTLDTTSMTLVSGKAAYQAGFTESELAESLATFRETQEYGGSYQYERRILEFVGRGDSAGLKHYIGNNEPFAPRAFSRKDPLRQNKNVLIYYGALATHAAIGGGLPPEIAYAICERYVQQAEDMHNLLDVSALMVKLLQELTRRVRILRHQGASKPVMLCREYIFQRLYEEITVPVLAAHVGLSPNYLSQLFHRETGQTISAYVQCTKIEEAQRLLQYTDRSILEISTLLNFRSQSYFSAVFKKIVGVSPGAWRRKKSGFRQESGENR